jgi:hypothetical protein
VSKTAKRLKFVLALLVAAPAFGQSPLSDDSSAANLTTAADGSPLLSWLQESKEGDSTSLQYSIMKGGTWSPARTIAAKRPFFHHPAELPEVISLSSGTLLAHWIETPEGGDEAEFIYVSASKDGVKWSTPTVAHKDRSMVQHGLAAMVATGPAEASIVWLQALKGESGPVSLMRSVVNGDGALVKEESLDSDVCNCCPTSIVKTARGLLVAYRDHTPADIRDIATVRFEGGKWLPSKIIFPDNWKINACPINAASAAANGDQVAVAWYTAAGEKARVEMAFSKDGGATFGKPALVSTGQAYGYSSVVLNDSGSATVSWLERGGGDARVLVRTVSADGTLGPVTEAAKGDRHNLGYPRLLRAGQDTWIVAGQKVTRLSK